MTQEPQDHPLQGGQPFVEKAIQALTGGLDRDLEVDDLRVMMESAAQEFDMRTARSFGSALLDQLSEDPANMRLLEALVILGLAHPEVLKSAAERGDFMGALAAMGEALERAPRGWTHLAQVQVDHDALKQHLEQVR